MGLLLTFVSNFELILSYVLPFLFVLGIVVIVHELGHFLVGRLCGVGVQAFSFGMGPELFGYTDRQGTRWRVSAVPIGGYVKFAGDTNIASVRDATIPKVSPVSERSVTLNGQRLPKRAAIVAAGPIANFIFSILILSLLVYFYGVASAPPRIDIVSPDTPAQHAGFKTGDIVKTIDGRSIGNFAEIIDAVSFKADEAMTFVVERDGAEVTLHATPVLTVIATPIGSQRVGRLGLGASTDPSDYRTIYLGPAAALGEGTSQAWKLVVRTGEYLARIVVGRASTDQLSGPIRIAQISNAVSLLGIGALLNLTAMLSISLGLMNFLPVPMLDGGHLLFYAIEAVRRKKMSPRAQELSLRVGLGLVAALTLFVTVNDLWRLVRA